MMAAKNILYGRGIENRLEAAPPYFYDYFDQLISQKMDFGGGDCICSKHPKDKFCGTQIRTQSYSEESRTLVPLRNLNFEFRKFEEQKVYQCKFFFGSQAR